MARTQKLRTRMYLREHTPETWDAACASGRLKGRRPIPSQLWPFIYGKHGNVCAHCKAKRTLHTDHIKPLAMGGGNEIANLQGLCSRCNTRKGGRRIG